MKKYIILIALAFICIQASAQLFMTRNGFIGFYSKTSLENIKAENNEVLQISISRFPFTGMIGNFIV